VRKILLVSEIPLADHGARVPAARGPKERPMARASKKLPALESPTHEPARNRKSERPGSPRVFGSKGVNILAMTNSFG